ncbi:uncharacterized protein [Periplaneta americana]|uniref:uncharacterized protein n=1 Tax=Periplaneta americana TaxID=6978 RepID=UPI0037E8E30D
MKTKADMDEARKDAKRTGGGPAKHLPEKSQDILAEKFQGQFDSLADTMDDDFIPFQEGPGPAIEETEEPIAVTSPLETESDIPMKNKRKKCSSENEFRQRILEMAEDEHWEKRVATRGNPRDGA